MLDRCRSNLEVIRPPQRQRYEVRRVGRLDREGLRPLPIGGGPSRLTSRVNSMSTVAAGRPALARDQPADQPWIHPRRRRGVKDVPAALEPDQVGDPTRHRLRAVVVVEIAITITA